MKSRLYTRTGDDGTTSLVGGTRAPKDCDRLEAYGTIDELNSWLGLLAAEPDILPERRDLLHKVQNTLFDIGAHLATEPNSTWQPTPIPTAVVETIEMQIDRIDSALPPLRQFILPGGSEAAARANIARTVARRAERRIITLQRTTNIDANIPKYINRLSDLLFAMAREININTGHDEIFWQKNC